MSLLLVWLSLVVAALPLDVTIPASVAEEEALSQENGCPRWVAVLLEQRWRPARGYVVLRRCTAGRYPAAGWYAVAMRREPQLDRDEYQRLRAIVASGGRAVVAENIAASAFTEEDRDESLESIHVLDLDGDGIDELVETRKYERRAMSRTWLEICFRRGERLATKELFTTTWEDAYQESFLEKPGTSVRYAATATFTAPRADGRRGLSVQGTLTRGRRAEPLSRILAAGGDPVGSSVTDGSGKPVYAPRNGLVIGHKTIYAACGTWSAAACRSAPPPPP